MSGHGGSRPGSGAKLKYTADYRFEVGMRVVHERKRLQKADVARQIESDPRTAEVRAAQAGVPRLEAQHYNSELPGSRTRKHVGKLVRREVTPKLDKIGRPSRYVPTKDYLAEAINNVAHSPPPLNGQEAHLSERTVRRFYNELPKNEREPERLYTLFDTWPRSKWKPPRRGESDFQWHQPEEADLYRGEWRQPADPDPDPDFAGSIAKTEHAERHRRRRK
jgi:hypothetical protein